ncbi:MAG: hypothetical protein EBZ77_07030 [Chitinophagia bacterium]|nr:hypothetical protein [Chitinophagia bacterium]
MAFSTDSCSEMMRVIKLTRLFVASAFSSTSEGDDVPKRANAAFFLYNPKPAKKRGMYMNNKKTRKQESKKRRAKQEKDRKCRLLE